MVGPAAGGHVEFLSALAGRRCFRRVQSPQTSEHTFFLMPPIFRYQDSKIGSIAVFPPVTPPALAAALQNSIDVKTVSPMLRYFDAGFTLRTYTHATRQKQDEEPQTVDSFMEQVM